MIKHLFSVYDSAAGAYLDPFVAPSIEFAMREFRTAVNKPEHQFNKYPEDYTLFHIGQFSSEKGKLQADEPISLGIGITYIEQLKLELEETESA